MSLELIECSVTGCTRPMLHYYQRKQSQPLCSGHYQRARLNDDVDAGREIAGRAWYDEAIELCQVPGCIQRRKLARWVDGVHMYLCPKHQTRYQRHGSFELPPR